MIYLLKRRKPADYDEIDAMVVRALDREAARQAAVREAMDYVRGDDGSIWLDPKITSCQRVAENGPERIVCVDFHAG